MMAVMQHSMRGKAFSSLILNLSGKEPRRVAGLLFFPRCIVPFVVFSIASYLNFDHGFLSEQAAPNKCAVRVILRWKGKRARETCVRAIRM